MALGEPTQYSNGQDRSQVVLPQGDVPRTRFRRERMKFDPTAIYERVKKFFDDDMIDHNEDRARRIQREAKFRMWSEGKDFPWEGASDVAFPDIMEKSLRVQDTLHNAVMSQEPPVNAVPSNEADIEKQRRVEQLLQYQFFVESAGEKIVGEMADAFVNEGTVVVYTPWVKDRRDIVDTRRFDQIPDGAHPELYFEQILAQVFGKQAIATPKGNSQYWDWKIEFVGKGGEQQKADCAFYTDKDDGSVELVIRTDTIVFDGPCPIVLDDDDILAPPRCANLQIPTPSNPRGAAHVIMRLPINADTIKRLIKEGVYDAVDNTEETLDSIDNYDRDTTTEQAKKARDTFQGAEESKTPEDKSHRDLTLLICFDSYDCNNDKINEDVIWWVILEAKLVVRARYLTEFCPFNPPRRPFAESQFTPVRGRRKGIGLVEMLESMHDLMKKTIDQAIDANDIAINPFFFYRKTAAVTPNIIRLWPGEGYPVSDPQRDIYFPQIGNANAMGFAINLFGLVSSAEERVSMIGDMQMGRVPAGKSSALRTIGGISLLQGQGEARPERVLRRFFLCLCDVWSMMHGLNRVWLPKAKQFRIMGPVENDENPYQTVTDRGEIGGNYQFIFKANVLNTSKEMLAQSLQELLGAFINPLTIQMGLITPEGIYRLFRAYARSKGQNVDDYLEKPTEGADKPKATAAEVVQQILANVEPDCVPAEGIEQHMQILVQFMQSDNFGLFSPLQVDIFRTYLMQLQQALVEQQEQQQMMAAAGEFQQSMTGGGQQTGRPAEQPPPSMAQPAISGPAELMDETLATAGGGGAKS